MGGRGKGAGRRGGEGSFALGRTHAQRVGSASASARRHLWRPRQCQREREEATGGELSGAVAVRTLLRCCLRAARFDGGCSVCERLRQYLLRCRGAAAGRRGRRGAAAGGFLRQVAVLFDALLRWAEQSDHPLFPAPWLRCGETVTVRGSPPHPVLFGRLRPTLSAWLPAAAQV
eukprot:SAG11_NODE_1001_length_6220_cov_6.550400_8_plen_174_part_00